MSTKPEWYSKENEKEPGNPLSRLEGWPRVQKKTSTEIILELLAVIDQKTAENWTQSSLLTLAENIEIDHVKEIDDLRAQLAAAEEEKEDIFDMGWTYGKRDMQLEKVPTSWAEHLAAQAAEKEK